MGKAIRALWYAVLGILGVEILLEAGIWWGMLSVGWEIAQFLLFALAILLSLANLGLMLIRRLISS